MWCAFHIGVALLSALHDLINLSNFSSLTSIVSILKRLISLSIYAKMDDLGPTHRHLKNIAIIVQHIEMLNQISIVFMLLVLQLFIGIS